MYVNKTMVTKLGGMNITSVANLVHKFSLRGNGISVTASSTLDLPEDWSPQTTS